MLWSKWIQRAGVFYPRVGTAEPDEIEICLQPNCKEAENIYGVRCIEYKGVLYFDSNIFDVNGKICLKEYRSGDGLGHPTGRIITAAIIKE